MKTRKSCISSAIHKKAGLSNIKCSLFSTIPTYSHYSGHDFSNSLYTAHVNLYIPIWAN